MTHKELNPREFVLTTEAVGFLTQLAWKDDDGKFNWMFFGGGDWIVYNFPEEHLLAVVKIIPEENICRFYMEP